MASTYPTYNELRKRLALDPTPSALPPSEPQGGSERSRLATCSADDLAADLANALWETSVLRHGLFTPVQFRSICERVIARRLHQQNAEISHANTNTPPATSGQ